MDYKENSYPHNLNEKPPLYFAIAVELPEKQGRYQIVDLGLKYDVYNLDRILNNACFYVYSHKSSTHDGVYIIPVFNHEKSQFEIYTVKSTEDNLMKLAGFCITLERKKSAPAPSPLFEQFFQMQSPLTLSLLLTK